MPPVYPDSAQEPDPRTEGDGTSPAVPRHQTEEYKRYQREYYQRNRERIRARQAEYVAAHKVEKTAYDREYYTQHKERIDARNRAYREADPETHREHSRRYYWAHVEARRQKGRDRARSQRPVENARRRSWQQRNPQKAHAIGMRRKARLRGAAVRDLTAAQWEAIKTAWGHRCAYCGATGVPLTQDHVIPLSKGGDHTASNIVPACLSCNSSKGAKLPWSRR